MSTRTALPITLTFLFTLALAGCASSDPDPTSPPDDDSADPVSSADLDAICILPKTPFEGVVAGRPWAAARGEARLVGGDKPIEARLYREEYASCADTCEAFIGFELPSTVGDFPLPETAASILGIDCSLAETAPTWTVKTGRVRVDDITDAAIVGAACMRTELDDGSVIDLGGTFALERCH